MSVLVICLLVFTVFCIVCTVFWYCFVHVYFFFFVLPVLVKGLLPPSDNSIAVTVVVVVVVIPQKICLFINTDARTSNLARDI